MLSEYLQGIGIDVLLTREPGGPKISEEIRRILLSTENKEMIPETEVLLYMASRSQHTAEWILPALQSGKWVISDRYYDSTRAYQGAARKIPAETIDILTRFATFALKPDLTFLVDLPAEIGLSRIEAKLADRLEQESLVFHQNVRKGFLQIAGMEKDRFVILDGRQSIEEIRNEIKAEISRYL
ncbi:MAG TPA: dTMP kinase [Candidatus Cloacimonadota bacterium]|nr:dTMP kinase [Candidatus Cloacimonadota bacterium]